MKREFRIPGYPSVPSDPLSVIEGGTDADTGLGACINLNLIHLSEVGAPGGICETDSTGKPPAARIPAAFKQSVRVSGPTNLVYGAQATYTITNYTTFTTYTLSCSAGTVSQTGNTITYTAPASGQAGGFVINDTTINIGIWDSIVATPTVASPTNGSTNQNSKVTVTSSAFSSQGAANTHASSSWQLATDPAFTNIVAQTTDDTVNKTSWTVTGLLAGTTYYVRVKHKGTNGNSTDWSLTSSFVTKTYLVPVAQQAAFIASDKAASDNFGQSVAISADGLTAAVGSVNADKGAVLDAGAVYIYILQNGAWVFQTKLQGADAANYDNEGYTVAISADGNTVLAGSAYDQNVGNTGYAYVFVRNGTTWTQQAKLQGSDSIYTDLYGYSVALSSDGNTAVVGAIWAAVAGVSHAGAAYVFVRSGTTWSFQAKIIPSDQTTGGIFGIDLSLSNDGNYLIVGASCVTVGGFGNAGAAYVFTRSGTTWTQQAKLTASAPAASDYFGTSVDINATGTIIAVGANWADVAGVTDAGAVFVFTRTGTTWTQQTIVSASNKIASDRYGAKVVFNDAGTVLAVSTLARTVNGNAGSGAVYVYEYANSVWNERAMFSLATTAANDNFGSDLSLDALGTTLLVGAANTDSGGVTDAGSAYIYG